MNLSREVALFSFEINTKKRGVGGTSHYFLFVNISDHSDKFKFDYGPTSLI
jgi:hypothetical protein